MCSCLLIFIVISSLWNNENSLEGEKGYETMFGIDCFQWYQLSRVSGVMMEKGEGAGASGRGITQVLSRGRGSSAGHSLAYWWQS